MLLGLRRSRISYLRQASPEKRWSRPEKGFLVLGISLFVYSANVRAGSLAKAFSLTTMKMVAPAFAVS